MPRLLVMQRRNSHWTWMGTNWCWERGEKWTVILRCRIYRIGQRVLAIARDERIKKRQPMGGGGGGVQARYDPHGRLYEYA